MDAPPRKTDYPRVKQTGSQDHIINLGLNWHKSERASFEAHQEEDPNKQALPTAVRQKKEKEKSNALQKCINVDLADLKNRRRQIAWSAQKKVRESYSFLPDERRSANNNVIIILTTM